MRSGILGSGLMGGKLGAIFARAGHEVVFSDSRNPRKLHSWPAGPEDAPGRGLRP
jgi:predicted dinucleotide-binding enzyme